jgi:hypothetical protein
MCCGGGGACGGKRASTRCITRSLALRALATLHRAIASALFLSLLGVLFARLRSWLSSSNSALAFLSETFVCRRAGDNRSRSHCLERLLLCPIDVLPLLTGASLQRSSSGSGVAVPDLINRIASLPLRATICPAATLPRPSITVGKWILTNIISPSLRCSVVLALVPCIR